MIRPEELTVDETAPLGGARIAMGTVFKGAMGPKNTLVAVKILSRDAAIDSLASQLETWKTLLHPNICVYIGLSTPDADPQYLVSDYYEHGNIRQYVSQNPNTNRPLLVFQVALGMQYLHSRGVLHGSLKTSNVLINNDRQACITDFGMVEALQIGSTSHDSHRYFSPEAWKGTISAPSDVYAFAMTALEVFTSKPPWGVLSDKHIYQLVVQQDSRPDQPDRFNMIRVGLTDHIWGLLEESWGKDPRLRPSFDIIVRMWGIPDPLSVVAERRKPEAHALAPISTSIQPEAVTEADRYRSTSPLSTISQMSGPPGYQSLVGSPVSPVPVHPLRSLSLPIPDIPRSNSITPTSAGPVMARSVSSPGPVSSPAYMTAPTTPSSAASDPPLVTPASAPSSYNRRSQSLGAPNPTLYTIDNRKEIRMSALPRITELPQRKLSYQPSYNLSTAQTPPPLSGLSISDGDELSGIQSGWKPRLRYASSRIMSVAEDNQSILSSSQSSTGMSDNPILLAGALQAELDSGRRDDNGTIDALLVKIQTMASQSEKATQSLIRAGVLPPLVHLLKMRSASANGDYGLDVVLVALGTLAQDSISANIIAKTNSYATLIEIFKSTATTNGDLAALALWCLNRGCRTPDAAQMLIKQGIVRPLIQLGLNDPASPVLARQSAWFMGTLAQTDSLVELLNGMGAIAEIVNYLSRCTSSPVADTEDLCAGLYAVARLSRSTRIAKELAKAGCVSLISHHLNQSEDPHILDWCARAVGCLMRPNGSEISRMLLEAGIAKGLARLPRVLGSEEVEPLGAFAFAVQRFSCAEWGSGTRKALVDAGVVDSLLAALRTAADEPYPHIHIELANSVSLLGDVGGSPIRKEIVSAGGVAILKRVAEAAGNQEVKKWCNNAVTSVTGNLWSRSAASAKTAMAHNWSGGCPEYQPPCPVMLQED